MEDNVYYVHRKKTMENKEIRAQVAACEAAYAEYAANQAAREMRKSLPSEKPAFLDRYFDFIAVASAVVSGTAIIAMCASMFTVPGGMGMLADYEHGYYMCGKPDPMINKVDVLSKVRVIPRHNYTVYLNVGHENDKEVQNLMAMALVQCSD